MPPKRQKTPKLTKQEKLALRKQKRDEKKVAQALKNKQLLREYLERELEYTRLSTDKNETKWRKMLLDIKLPECRDGLELAWRNFERIVDAKDFTISMMMDELDVAFEQQMMVGRVNMNDMDRLLQMFNGEVEDMHADYKQTAESLKSENKQVEDIINLTEADGAEYLRLVMFGVLETRKHYEKNVRGDYVQDCADLIGRNKSTLYNMRYGLENEFEDLFNHINLFTNEFLKMTAERKMQYDKLHSSDSTQRFQNSARLDRIKKMRVVIKRLKQKFIDNKLPKLQKIDDLKKEKHFLLEGYTILKEIMHYIMRTTNGNIRQLVVTSNDTITYLKKLQTKGESLLKLILVCSKFQTEEEKVFALPRHRPCNVEKDELKNLKESYTPIILRSFWAKVAEAETKRLALVEERNVLLKENRKLKNKIAEYCTCLDCPTLPLIDTKKTKKDRINVLLANEIVKKYKAYDSIGH